MAKTPKNETVADVVEAVVEEPAAVVEAAQSPEQQPVSGRSVFPNMEYALQQIDEMRHMVINQFTSAPA